LSFIDIFSYNIISPAILVGDRSLTNVIIYELIHSWTSTIRNLCYLPIFCVVGNLVTNENWKHFWLDEGFTSFIEAKLVGILVSDNGEARRFHSTQRSKGLE
jgi:leukotriene-A4 hydrolase